MFLKPYEVHILDSPLIQRLRYIHQNGITFFVYPTCLQTRFDHSLGVTLLAEKFTDFLIDKGNYRHLIDDVDRINLKLASLLHDVGHGLFSHLSEEIYAKIDYFKNDKEEFEKSLTKGSINPHEFLSYKIIKSKSFSNFIQELSDLYGFQYDLGDIADFIIGEAKNHEDKQFLAKMLNGTIDVDKLDYMKRDSYFLGFHLPVEIEQIFYRTKIQTDPSDLVINYRGIHNIDQLIFNRAFLYSSVYLHHKIRATSYMIKAIFSILKDKGIKVHEIEFNKVTDFLSINDNELLFYRAKDPTLSKHLQNIQNRKMFKRILEIYPSTIKKFTGFRAKYNKFLNDYSNDKETMRKEILNVLKVKKVNFEDYELWLDYIPEVTYDDLLPQIQMSENNCVLYENIFNVQDFIKNYFLSPNPETAFKLKFYVFGRPDNEFREEVSKILIEHIEKKYKFKLKPEACSKIIKKGKPLTYINGIGKTMETMLKKEGYNYVEDLVEEDPKKISKLINGCSENKAKGWIKQAEKIEK